MWWFPCRICHHKGDQATTERPSASVCLFHVSQTLIAGWDRLECHRVFNFLCELTHLLKNIEAVLIERPGEGINVWRAKKSSEEQENIHIRSVFSLVWAFPQDWKDTRSGRFVFIAVMSCWTVGQTSQLRSSGWLFSSILGHLSARHAYCSSCTDPHALMVRMNVNYHSWFRWVLPDRHLVQSNCVFFVLNCGTNTSLQEPWIGIAWWRWSCHAGLCGKWPMPSTYSLVTRTWKISPISPCWPFWRSLSVSHFISCQHLSAHMK